MINHPPYVIAFCSSAAGVGKSTLAGNLAVHLRAVDEELPLAVLTEAADSSAAGMLRFDSRADWQSISETSRFIEGWLRWGEFGVCWGMLPAAPEGESASWLRKVLAGSNFPGILILDIQGEGPATEAAISAADLLLTPVKNTQDLSGINRIKKLLLDFDGSSDQLWLLPSELGSTAGMADHLERDEFLRFAAKEKGFQVFAETFRSDPQVASLSSHPAGSILTRLPQSSSQKTLLALAELVLGERSRQTSFPVRWRRWLADGLLPGIAGRIQMMCPLCGVPAWPGEVRYLESFPRRLRMLLHDECLTDILEGSNAGQFYDQNGALLVESAQLHREPRRGLMLQLFDDILRPMGREHVAPQAAWDALVYQATGQRIAELYGDRLLISPAKPVSQLLSSSWFTQWRAVRRRLHEQCREEIF